MDPPFANLGKRLKMDEDGWRIEAVEAILGYGFRSKMNLLQALTHPSCFNSQSYQNLEFLGDAVLNMAISKFIFHNLAHLKPTKLANIRSFNTSADKLGCVAIQHGFYLYMKYNSTSIAAKIEEFILTVRDRNKEMADRSRDVKAPKILADVVKAIAAAVYVDLNYNLEQFWMIFRRFMEPIARLDDDDDESCQDFSKPEVTSCSMKRKK